MRAVKLYVLFFHSSLTWRNIFVHDQADGRTCLLWNYIFKFDQSASIFRLLKFHGIFFGCIFFPVSYNILYSIYFRLGFISALFLYYFRIICVVLHIVCAFLFSFYLPPLVFSFSLAKKKRKTTYTNYCSFRFYNGWRKRKKFRPKALYCFIFQKRVKIANKRMKMVSF